MFLNNFPNTHKVTIDGAVYFSPNGCKGRRLKENLTHINAIFADFDFKPKAVTGDSKPDFKQFMLDLDDLPTPTYVVESGNGWHLYWCLEEPILVTDENRDSLIEQVEGMHRFLNQHYGADNGAIDVLHLLRQPGFEHKKMPEHPFMVDIVVDNSEDRYTLDELLVAMPPITKEVKEDVVESDDDFDIRKVAVDVWATKGDVVEWDTIGRMIWNGEKTGTFIGRNGGGNYIATTSESYPYKGNATTYVAGVLGISTKEAYKWLIGKYGEIEHKVKDSLVQDTKIEDVTNITLCPERAIYKRYINNPESKDDKDFFKKKKALQEQYKLAFHNYFAEVYQHLHFEVGEDGVYWNYNEVSGIYEEINGTTAREWVMRLLIDEDLIASATDATAKTVLARYRSCYTERGHAYDDFDNEDLWFHAENGWVNLESLVFEEHTATRLSRRKSAVAYDAKVVCPVYDKFINEDLLLKEDQIRVIDQFSGLILTKEMKHEKMLTLLGRTGCGKSTLLNTWSRVLGEMALEKKLTELSSESARFAGSQFVGSTLCWFDEVDVKKAEMGNSLGTLVTGKHINVERKGINGIKKAVNSVKCVLTANRLPMTAEIGIYRRLILINITASFVEAGTVDRDIDMKLGNEASGILNRMIKGLQDLRKMGTFTMIAGHDDLIEEYKAQSDTIAEFLDEYFDVGTENDFIETKNIYESYRHFAEGNSWTRSITPQKFGRLLASQPLTRFAKIAPKRTMDSRGWTGLKLKKEYKFSETGLILEVFSSDF